MRIRGGFVSNSSSSSFIISKDNLSPEQIKLIKTHIVSDSLYGNPGYSYLKEYDEETGKLVMPERSLEETLDLSDEWLIHETDEEIQGATSMDNFEMDNFLEAIGVDPDVIEWGDDYGTYIDLYEKTTQGRVRICFDSVGLKPWEELPGALADANSWKALAKCYRSQYIAEKMTATFYKAMYNYFYKALQEKDETFLEKYVKADK